MSIPPNHRALFVQPFGFSSSGGGARIFSSLLKGQPFDLRSINSSPNPAPPIDWASERHLPIRPRLGRVDRSRFAGIGDHLERFARSFFARQLAREINEWRPDLVHILPHAASDFAIAWRTARAHGCRVVMSVHDDLRYTLDPNHPLRAGALDQLARIWRDADHLFVISEELGQEYAHRYGARPFEIITDGLTHVAERPAPVVPRRLTVYFMGLFHYVYRDNLRALTRALARLKKEQPDLNIRLIMRCGSIEKNIDAAFPATILPFAAPEVVALEMAEADLLYLPLPIGERYASFTRYSLSTKMISYLGSGKPILYHGPCESAANHLLTQHRASWTCHSHDEGELQRILGSAHSAQDRSEIIENALRLAKSSFMLDKMRDRFRVGLFP